MASQPEQYGERFRVKWYAKVNGKATFQQVILPFKADAQRLSDYVTDVCKNNILATDSKIVNRAWAEGEVAAIKRAAGARTWSVVYAEWVERKSPRWSESTRKLRVQTVAKHFAVWGDRPIAEIGAADLNERYAAMGKDISHNYVIKTLGVVKACLAWANAKGYTRYNPMVTDVEGCELAFDMSVDEGTREHIEADVFRALLAHADEYSYAPMLTMASVGARLGECFALRVGDVDLYSMTIKIQGTMQGKLRSPFTKGEQNGRKRKVARPTPISPELAEVLRPLVEGRPDAAPLFAAYDGRSKRYTLNHWHPDVWRDGPFERTVAAARAAGVRLPEDFTPHCFRHSMATWLARVLPMPELMVRMRHASIRMTAKYYHDSDVSRQRERDAVVAVMGTPTLRVAA